MKTITLENGTKVQISEESYNELAKAVQPSFKDEYEKVREFIKKRVRAMFGNWDVKYKWLNDEQAYNEMIIYLSMKYWKSLYDSEFVPVFKGYNQEKFYLEQFNGKWEINEAWQMKHNMQVYVSSREKARQMLEDLKSVGVIK